MFFFPTSFFLGSSAGVPRRAASGQAVSPTAPKHATGPVWGRVWVFFAEGRVQQVLGCDYPPSATFRLQCTRADARVDPGHDGSTYSIGHRTTGLPSTLKLKQQVFSQHGTCEAPSHSERTRVSPLCSTAMTMQCSVMGTTHRLRLGLEQHLLVFWLASRKDSLLGN